MDDKTLLELAAKAAGIVGDWGGIEHVGPDEIDFTDMFFLADSTGYWNPLADDGDALRLAVKIGIVIDVRYTKPEIAEHNCANYWLPGEEHQGWSSVELGEHTDPYAATRRAIVRAAAAIGESMGAK
jgi:hypothetical protein